MKDKQTLKEFHAERADHYFAERVRLESAARVLCWAMDMGADTTGAKAELEEVLESLVLHCEKDTPKVGKPSILHMLACGKFGPAFQARMEVVQ